MSCFFSKITVSEALKTIPNSRKAAYLSFFVLLQGVLIYFLAFEEWRGPGDWGSNLGYLPAVMIAAGRGFVVTDVDVIPELRAFMDYQTTYFDVSLLSGDIPVEPPNLEYQWYQYLLYMVGFIWRLFGVSWGVVRILTLFFLFMSGLCVYGISRLCLPASWSLCIAHAFVWNGAVLQTLHSFRDFSKGAFVLCVLLLVGIAIRKPVKRFRYLGIACLIGVVLGIGMGFRRDMQAVLPLSILMLITCRLLPNGKQFRYKLMAACLVILLFLLFSFPVLIAFHPKRWTNAHDMIMGFATQSDRSLQVLAPASYEKHYLQHDVYTTWQSAAAMNRGISMTHDQREQFKNNAKDIYGAPLYAYIKTLASLFPSDVISRAYAAVLISTRGMRSTLFLPFVILEPFGLLFVLAGLFMIAVLNWRLASQILLLLVLFCGYTSLQHGERHAFHLSFIPYWFGCFCLYHGLRVWRTGSWKTYLPHGPQFRNVLFALTWLFIAGTIFYLPLKVAHMLQVRQVSRVLKSYQEAERISVQHTATDGWEGQTLLTPENKSACETCTEIPEFPPSARVRIFVAHFAPTPQPIKPALVYEWDNFGADLTGFANFYTRPGVETGNVDYYFVVYESYACNNWNRFAGLLLPNEQVKFFKGFSEITASARLLFLCNMTVPENKEAFEPLQRLLLPWPYRSLATYPTYDSAFRDSRKYEIIMHLIHTGNTETAISLCKQALEHRPGSIQFQAPLAQALLLEHHDDEAWEVIHALLRQYPEDNRLYSRLDMLFSRLNGNEACYESWNRVVLSYPQLTCAKYFLGNAVLNVCKDSLEQLDLNRCQELIIAHPEFDSCTRTVSNFLEKQGQPETRTPFWLSITEEIPEATLPWLYLGIALEQDGDLSRAREAYERAIKNGDRHGEAALRYASMDTFEGNANRIIEEVECILTQYANLEPVALHSLQQTAERYERNDFYADASILFRWVAMRLHSSSKSDQWEVCLLRAAETSVKGGGWESALSIYGEILRINPLSSSAAAGVHGLFEKSELRQEQIGFWKTLAEQHPDNVLPWLWLGRAYEEQGRQKEAQAAFAKAHFSDPGHGEAALRYAATGTFSSDDFSTIEQAVRNDPALATLAAYYLEKAGDVHLSNDKIDAAQRFYQKAAHYTPDNPWIKIKTAKTLLLSGAMDQAKELLYLLASKHNMYPADIQARTYVLLVALDDDEADSLLNDMEKELSSETIDSIIQQLSEGAAVAAKENRFIQGKKMLRRAVDLAPNSEAAWVALGVFLEKYESTQNALGVYSESLSHLKPGRMVTQNIEGLLESVEDVNQRIQTWQAIAESNPSHETVLLHLGMSLEENEQFPEAVSIYRKIIDQNLSSEIAQMRLGGSLVLSGAVEQGLQQIMASAEQNSSLKDSIAEYCLHVGSILLKHDDLENAAQLYALATTYAPDNPHGWLQLGEAHLQRGDIEEAVQAWRNAIRTSPDSAVSIEAGDHIDIILLSKDRLGLWQDMLNQIPENPYIQLRFLLALADTDNYEKAIVQGKDILDHHPEDPDVQLVYGILLCRSGQIDQGLGLVKNAAVVSPRHALTASRMLDSAAEQFLEARHFNHAEQLWRSIIEMYPEDMKFTARLGLTLLEQEKYTEAIAQFKRVLMVAPESPHTAMLMDKAYMSLKDLHGRHQAWREISTAHPEAVIPQRHLKECAASENAKQQPLP